MSRFIESIKYRYGVLYNLAYHNARADHARRSVLGIQTPLQLEDQIQVPAGLGRGLYKCRVVFGEKIEQVSFVAYRRRHFSSLKLVEGGAIDYSHKYSDRTAIDALFQHRDTSDDILIIRDGLVTDTSYANVAFLDGERWVTPDRPLLSGTKRQQLLDDGLIHEAEIRADDLGKYQSVALFNAMMELDPAHAIPIGSILQ